MNNRWIVSLSLIGMLLFMAACADGENTATEETAPGPVETQEVFETEELVEPTTSGMPVMGSGLCANAYYPVREGATWTYLGTSSATGDYAFTNTISSVRDDGFTITIDFDDLTLTQQWACTPDGILALEMGGGSAGTLTTSGMNLVMDTQNASGITFPNEIQPGSTWDHTLDFTGTMDFAGETVEVSGSTEYNYTAIEIESVTVSAGTFDAMKVQVVTTINMEVNMQGSTLPVTFSSTSTSWYVQGVGWVKSESSSEFGGITSIDTVDLQSYSIP
ncbi:MAG TPA: hypothetical protein VK851_15035 [Anaerolineales bacterium]|nr:hypothetical protein [Anaerolineales bacterium]